MNKVEYKIVWNDGWAVERCKVYFFGIVKTYSYEYYCLSGDAIKRMIELIRE